MGRHAALRLVRVLPLLVLVSLIAFGLLNLLPGDPAVQIAGEFATEEQIEQVRADLELDRPWVERYGAWLWDAARGDLGTSVFSGISVREQIVQRLPATVSLIGLSLFLSAAIGVGVGVLAGWKQGTRIDRVITLATTVGIAIPVFVSGLLLVLVFALKLDWLPATGYVPLTESPWDWLKHLILPAFALSLTGSAEVARQTRAGVADVAKRDHIQVARASGLHTRQILGRHTLKNAMIPVVTVIGLQIGRMFGLSVIVEQLFNIPGLGSRLVTAVFENDVPLIQGAVLVVGGVIILVNALVDISYGYFNPRVRPS